MYYKYPPYPYFNRYYNINPYYYGRYYSPYYNYQQNIIDSQIANVDQRIDNYGYMTDVIQNSDVYQFMSAAPEIIEVVSEHSVETPPDPPVSLPTPHIELPSVELPPEIPAEIPISQPPPLSLP